MVALLAVAPAVAALLLATSAAAAKPDVKEPRDESPRSRGAVASESCVSLAPTESRGRREGRVQAAPMARQQKEKLAAVTTGLAEHPAFPAQRCYGL